MSKATTPTAVKTALVPRRLTLWLPGRVVPKQRPRFAGKVAYLPTKYREWKLWAVLELLTQLGDRAVLPIPRASVEMVFVGSHRGDADNLSGAILDTLVQSGVLEDDRLAYIPRLVIQHEPNGELGVNILIRELL